MLSPDRASDHHIIRELLVHGVAFVVAATLSAIVLRHFYWFFEGNTDDPSGAREAFLASVIVVGGLGPALTMLFFWIRPRDR